MITASLLDMVYSVRKFWSGRISNWAPLIEVSCPRYTRLHRPVTGSISSSPGLPVYDTISSIVKLVLVRGMASSGSQLISSRFPGSSSSFTQDDINRRIPRQAYEMFAAGL